MNASLFVSEACHLSRSAFKLVLETMLWVSFERRELLDLTEIGLGLTISEHRLVDIGLNLRFCC